MILVSSLLPKRILINFHTNLAWYASHIDPEIAIKSIMLHETGRKNFVTFLWKAIEGNRQWQIAGEPHQRAVWHWWVTASQRSSKFMEPPVYMRHVFLWTASVCQMPGGLNF